MTLLARSATLDDLDALLALAQDASPALTNLPPDRERLAARLESSSRAFQSEATAPEDVALTLVVEDDDGEVLGTATLKPLAGGREVYYTYRRETLIHASQQLDVRREVDILSISHEMSHATLLCALATRRDHPARGEIKRLLRAARLALVAAVPERFAPLLFVALPGYQSGGRSPFWEGVGRHFFSREFEEVHRAASLGSKSFIGEVMPPFPLYQPLLDDAARDAIGRVHPLHSEALEGWQREGFTPSRHVDLLDGGPLLEAGRDHLPRPRRCPARLRDQPAERGEGEMLLASQRDGGFRALLSTGATLDEQGRCVVDAGRAQRLGVDNDTPLLVLERRECAC
ncbi:arginine N-succinyltransferase [Kushneria aurantia]|uniref:Arginine N-succinyltransferase n=1 Tax=Kushneria aurantia TaxID=504092 RepID=A0ABV6G9V8_9GAMM|nr:arginine N-succinyltransferase [Kushneria aurantia]